MHVRGVHRIFIWFFNVGANNQVGATPTQLASYNSTTFTMLTCMLSILADSALNFEQISATAAATGNCTGHGARILSLGARACVPGAL